MATEGRSRHPSSWRPAVKQILCVHLPRWPITVARRIARGKHQRLRAATHKQLHKPSPLVLIKTVASRQVIAFASAEAESSGVHPGMTLAEARALCPALQDLPHAPDQDLRALQTLARWATRFSPTVAILSSSLRSTGILPVSSSKQKHGQDARATKEIPEILPALFLDVTGCERLYAGLHNLLEQIRDSLRSLHLPARLAIAPTPGAAWAIASTSHEDGQIIHPHQLRSALAPLPPTALRIEEESAQTLHHLGIWTIAQLLDIPRHALPARFGQSLLLRIDQALGRIDEPLTPLTHDSPLQSSIDFEGPIDALETIWLAFKELIAPLVTDLRRRGHGARRMEITFLRPYAPPISKTILLSRPSRNPLNLFNLIRCAMETLEEAQKQSGAKVKKGRSALAQTRGEENRVSEGFIGLRLSIPIHEPLSEEQLLLAEQDEHDAQVELDLLIERLCLRLGPDSIATAHPTECYIPEKSFMWHGLPAHNSKTRAGSPCHTSVMRPLILLPPTEVRVMVSPSHDRDGKPVALTHDNHTRRIVHAIGPERIAGHWWEGHHRTRDYFDIEDETGRRSWVFRVLETSKWYVHGEFE